MPDTKFTPGPLVARQSPKGHYEVVAPDAPKTKQLVARCGGPDREGNATLFAASQGLLAVVESMVEMMDSGEEHGAGSKWHQDAKAAIVKATGGI